MGQLVIPEITCMVREGQRQNTYKEDKTEVLGKKYNSLATSTTTTLKTDRP